MSIFKRPLPPFVCVILCLIMGAITHLSFAPLYLWPLPVMTLSTLMCLCMQQKMRIGLLYGFAFGYGLYTTHLFWVTGVITYITPKAFPYASLFLALYPACLWGLFGLAFTGIMHRIPHAFAPITFAAIWVGTELILSTLSYGLPWNMLGYITSPSLTLMQTASLGSVFLLSFLVVFCSTSLGYGLFKRQHILHAVIILSMWSTYGYMRLSSAPAEDTGLNIRLIQTGINIEDKDAHSALAFIKKNRGLTQEEGLKQVNIIVWPEWGAPVDLQTNSALYRYIVSVLTGEQTLITGTKTFSTKGAHNAVATLKKHQNPTFFAKNILVPFAEFIPLNTLLPAYARTLTQHFTNAITPGQKPALLQTHGLNFTPLICYEALHPFYVARQAAGRSALIQVSNDYWLDHSFAAAQLYDMSRLRAIETGKPLLRAANTGTSAIIDAYGRERLTSEKYFPDVLDAPLPAQTKTPTLWMSLIGALQQ